MFLSGAKKRFGLQKPFWKDRQVQQRLCISYNSNKGWAKYRYCIVSYRDIRQYIVIDFGYCYIAIWRKCCLFLVEKAWLQWSDMISDLTRLFLLFFHWPFIHFTDDYLSKNVIELIFCEITNTHPYNTVPVLRYMIKDYVIFTHFITLALPPLRMHNKSSVTTYMINNYQHHLHCCDRFFTCIAQV